MTLARRQRTRSRILLLVTTLLMIPPIIGCGPSYRQLRREGQQAMIGGAYGPARILFRQAEDKRPRRAQNLYDLGSCSVMLAKDRFTQGNEAAAMRELDAALDYFNASIDAHPGFTPSIEGKNTALKLRGQFDEALKNAEWAATFVGPSAKQYMFLADELEQRGDSEGALLRYRQAVSLEPKNHELHVAFARFLLRHDNETAAVFHLQAAYRLDPSDTWVTDELAQRGAIPTLVSDRPSNRAQP